MSQKTSRSFTKQPFTVHLVLLFEAELKKTLQNASPRMKIATIRSKIEQDLGILPEMYFLTYLDASPLDENATLQDYFVVNGSTLHLRPWRMWQDLLQAAYLGQAECTFSAMDVASPSKWSRHCAWCALYIASHQGHFRLVARLLQSTSVAINTQSPCGWTALHAAARMGCWKVLCVLVDNGADVRVEDNLSLTAFDLARKFGNKKCENSLSFCRWNLQKHFIIEERSKEYVPMKVRQTAEREQFLHKDSTLPTWLCGPTGQIYMSYLPNPVTVEEVKHYEKAKMAKQAKQSISSDKKSQVDAPSAFLGASKLEEDKVSKLDFNYGWFDSLRAQKFIPSTTDVLTYANPSSCSLRPKTLLNPDGFSTPLVKIDPAPMIENNPRFTNQYNLSKSSSWALRKLCNSHFNSPFSFLQGET